MGSDAVLVAVSTGGVAVVSVVGGDDGGGGGGDDGDGAGLARVGSSIVDRLPVLDRRAAEPNPISASTLL